VTGDRSLVNLGRVQEKRVRVGSPFSKTFLTIATNMVLSSAALRLYIRYKAHSADLFQDITAGARNLADYHTWRPREQKDYETWISNGFVRNLICHGARRRFRDQYVPPGQRDDAHEKAIANAEENCSKYAELYAQLQTAKLSTPAGQSSDSEPDDEDIRNVAHPNGATRAATAAGPSRRRIAKAAEREEEQAIVRAWKAAMSERAAAETEAEKVVMRLYDRSVTFLKRLKVRDDETVSVLAGALFDLAPRALRAESHRAMQQEAPDDADLQSQWWDPPFVAELKKHVDIPDETLERILLSSTIEHRTVCPKVAPRRVQVSRADTSLRGDLSALLKAGPHPTPPGREVDIALLLGVIKELRPQRCMGDYVIRMDLIASYRTAVAEYVRTGCLPPVELSGTTRLGIGKGTDAISDLSLLALMYAEGHHHPGLKQAGIGSERALRQPFRTLRPLLKKRGCAQADLVIKTFTRFVDGSIPLHNVILHPALFLHELTGPISEFGAHMASFVGRTLDEDSLGELLHEVERVLFTAAALMSVQYSECEGKYPPGKAPKWMCDRNPFDDPKHMIYAAAAARKTGIIAPEMKGEFELRKLPKAVPAVQS
jgi:hypothetical protein